MKSLVLVLSLVGALFASEYYAKLEPIQTYVVKSAVSGKVLFSNENIEGFTANNSRIIEIDSHVNKMELKQVNKKLDILNSMIKIEQKNYNRLKQVKTRSAFEKDTQLLKSLNLESSKADLLIRQTTLIDTINNKKLVEKNRYIYNINVKKGDYVNAGTLLYEAKDLKKAKLKIFIPINEAKSIKNKTIYLDGKKTDFKTDKIYQIADSKHISSYQVDIVVDNPKIFSRLVKIEFK